MDVAPILLVAIVARQDPAHIQAQDLAPRVDGRVCRSHASLHRTLRQPHLLAAKTTVTQPAPAAAAARQGAARVMRRGQ